MRSRRSPARSSTGRREEECTRREWNGGRPDGAGAELKRRTHVRLLTQRRQQRQHPPGEWPLACGDVSVLSCCVKSLKVLLTPDMPQDHRAPSRPPARPNPAPIAPPSKLRPSFDKVSESFYFGHARWQRYEKGSRWYILRHLQIIKESQWRGRPSPHLPSIRVNSHSSVVQGHAHLSLCSHGAYLCKPATRTA